MKKILISILIITTAAALISLGTFAYFSDIEKSPSTYTATTGTIDISVGWPRQPAGQNTIADLKPSQVRYLTEYVRNVGKNPAVINKHTHVNGTSDGAVVEPERAEGTDASGKYVPRHDIDKVILYDLTVIVRKRRTAKQTVIIRNPADGENGLTLAQISSKWIKLGVLNPGEYMIVRQSYHMKKSTTHWAQADSVNFSMDFLAAQTNDDTTFKRSTGIPDPSSIDAKQGDWNVDSFFDVFTEL